MLMKHILFISFGSIKILQWWLNQILVLTISSCLLRTCCLEESKPSWIRPALIIIIDSSFDQSTDVRRDDLLKQWVGHSSFILAVIKLNHWQPCWTYKEEVIWRSSGCVMQWILDELVNFDLCISQSFKYDRVSTTESFIPISQNYDKSMYEK